MNLKIEADFRDLLPPLSDDEFAQLKANLKTNPDGFPPIVVWKNYKGGNVIVDGHHQYKARSSLGLPVKVKKLEFDDRQAAMLYAIQCQAGRRNISASERARIAAKLVTTSQGRPPSEGKTGKFAGLLETTEKQEQVTQKQAAEAVGVSERLVRDAVKAEKAGVTNGAVSKAAATVREREAPKPKQGAAVPWDTWEQWYGKLKRTTDDIARIKPNQKLQSDIHKLLNAVFELKKQWQKSK